MRKRKVKKEEWEGGEQGDKVGGVWGKVSLSLGRMVDIEFGIKDR